MDALDVDVDTDVDPNAEMDSEVEAEPFDLEIALARMRGDVSSQPLGVPASTGDVDPSFTSGFVALIGRPNAGKSTLVNAVVGEKVAITSDTPQTTRHRLRAILDRPGMQMILVDTPGLHKPHDALGEELNHSALKALEDVDVVAMLVDASKPIGKGDVWVSSQLANIRSKKVLVITKADIAHDNEAQLQMNRARDLAAWDDVVVVSALKGFNVEGFVSAVQALLPHGPRWFTEGTTTDQSLDVLVAETIREKILRATHDEVPHSVGVQTESLEFKEKKNLYAIYATVYVERESQRGIIVGHGGSMIKHIGISARHDLEHLLGAQVFLDLNVKVKRDWRSDAAQIRRFGYGEGL